jgi:hypothetical protein
MSMLPENVDRIEYRGTSYAGQDAIVLLDSLDDAGREEVSVVFKDGLRTSLTKLEASSGDALRIEGDKVYF